MHAQTAARMLLRVASSIDQFPAHVVQLLTSTVVQCAKAKLWHSAHQHAVALMQPSLRAQLPPEHRKKVENLVRKKDDTYVAVHHCKESTYVHCDCMHPLRRVDPPEPLSACPWCSAMGPETALVCGACHETIPFCCATGPYSVCCLVA